MSIFEQISARIIKEQELIIGPLAWEEAKKVPGLKIIDAAKAEVLLTDNAGETLNKLVSQYERLFGQASKEACKDAVQDLVAELPKDQVPLSLQ